MPVAAYNGAELSTGNGVTTVFAYTFPILASADLAVYLDDVLQSSGYTVSGVGASSGGNITFTTAPANGVIVRRERAAAYSRSQDYQRNGSFDEETVDKDFDRSVMLIQQVKAITDLCFQVSAGEDGFDPVLLDPVASKLIGINSDGDGLALYAMSALSEDIVPSAFMETVLDDTSAAAARTTLGAAASGVATSSGLTIAATNTILGRTTAGAGALEERTVGEGLLFDADGLDALVTKAVGNAGLHVSLSGGEMTISLYASSASGTPTANDVVVSGVPTTVVVGAATLTALSRFPISSAASLVISSGSTLGTQSAKKSRIWIAAVSTGGGAVALAAFNALDSSGNIHPIMDEETISTTAEGGAGAADSAGVWYATAAHSSKTFRVLGYIESTQATAGTWATNPSKIVIAPDVRPGDVVQSQISADSAVATGATAVPWDDTIPGAAEGAVFMTKAITPTNAANVLDIEHVGVYAHATAVDYLAVSVHQDGGAALKTACNFAAAAAVQDSVTLRHRMIAETAASTTFTIRAGTASGYTVTFNGSAGGRKYGGVSQSHLIIREIFA